MKRRAWCQAAAAVAAVGLGLAQVQAQPAVQARLQQAVISDDYLWIRRWLAQGGDPNTVVVGTIPALVRALQLESWRVAQELLTSTRLDLNAASGSGETPLMMACIRGHLPLVQQMVAMGADINRPGWTPLHYAASATLPDSVAIARLLLEHHAYIDAPSPNQSTPLMLAAQYGSQEMVLLLLNAGADVLARNELGLGVVDFARKSDRDYMVKMMQQAEQAAQRGKGSW